MKMQAAKNEFAKGQLISKANYGFKTSSKKQTKLNILEDYYLKVNTKRESMFFLQEDRLPLY